MSSKFWNPINISQNIFKKPGLLHLSRVPLAPARRTNQSKSPESLGTMAEFNHKKWHLFCSSLGLCNTTFPNKKIFSLLRAEKMHQTASIEARLEQKKCYTERLWINSQKTNCCKLLKLKHPACQRPHATWQDLFGPQNGYNSTGYVFISCRPIWTSA